MTPRAYAGASRSKGLAVADAIAREDGLYAVLYVHGPSAEAAAEGLAAIREEVGRLPSRRSADHLADALLASHSRLAAMNAEQIGEDGPERRRLLGVAGLMSRTDTGFDIAHVGLIRTLVVRRGRLLLPLVPPLERVTSENKIIAELLGGARRPGIALSEATAEGGDLFAITTKSILQIPEQEIVDLLARASGEDVTGALVDRVEAIVTIPVPGPPPGPELGRAPGLTWAALSSVGTRRSNEDSYRIFGEEGIFVAGDGLGGHEQGAVASRVGVDTAAEVFAAEGRWVPASDTANRACELAAYRVSRRAGSGGTTLDVLRIRDRRAAIAHVGDSRVYLLREGELRQLTMDHSVVADMVRQGTLTPDQARSDPHRNIITRAIGHKPEPPDLIEIDIQAGDVLLMCSDGLTGPVADSRIREIVEAGGSDLGRAATDLIEAAYQGGAPDNVTALLVRIDRGKPRPRAGRVRKPKEQR